MCGPDGQALRKLYGAYARDNGFQVSGDTVTVLDIAAMTRVDGFDLDKTEGVPHDITLPHKVRL